MVHIVDENADVLGAVFDVVFAERLLYEGGVALHLSFAVVQVDGGFQLVQLLLAERVKLGVVAFVVVFHLKKFHHDVRARTGYDAAPVLYVFQVDEKALHQVFAHVVLLLVEPEKYAQVLKKFDGAGEEQAEVQNVEHVVFHFEDFLPGVGVVRDVYEIVHLRQVDFLVLARDHERRDAQQLQLGSGHLLHRQVAVDYGNRHEQALVREPELAVHVYQPVHQNAAHLLVYLLLVLHVVVLRLGVDALVFLQQQVVVY